MSAGVVVVSEFPDTMRDFDLDQTPVFVVFNQFIVVIGSDGIEIGRFPTPYIETYFI
jgi:hypothetical protein